jgi:hypothetical protein
MGDHCPGAAGISMEVLRHPTVARLPDDMRRARQRDGILGVRQDDPGQGLKEHQGARDIFGPSADRPPISAHPELTPELLQRGVSRSARQTDPELYPTLRVAQELGVL